MIRYAIFVRRWDGQRQGFGRRIFVGHVVASGFYTRYSPSNRERAIDQARQTIAKPPLVRSCDLLEAEMDNATDRPWYGPPVTSPGGVGLL